MYFLSFVFSLLFSSSSSSSSGLLVGRESWGFLGVSCDCLCVCRVCCSRSRFRREVVSPIFTYLVLFFPGVGNVAGECPRA